MNSLLIYLHMRPTSNHNSTPGTVPKLGSPNYRSLITGQLEAGVGDVSPPLTLSSGLVKKAKFTVTQR